MSRKRRPENPGWFRRGHDPRRHILTPAEKRRGGIQCAKKFTVCGQWHTDWWDRCAAKRKGEY